MARQAHKFGLWLVGAHGGIGTIVTLGIEAIRRGLADPLGLIGHLPPFDRLDLAPLGRWVIGGHEIRRTTFETAARELYEQSGLLGPELITASRLWLRQCDRNVRDGTVVWTGRIGSLRRFKDDVREVEAGLECGVVLEGFQDVKVGDVLEAFETRQVEKTLE